MILSFILFLLIVTTNIIYYLLWYQSRIILKESGIYDIQERIDDKIKEAEEIAEFEYNRFNGEVLSNTRFVNGRLDSLEGICEGLRKGDMFILSELKKTNEEIVLLRSDVDKLIKKVATLNRYKKRTLVSAKKTVTSKSK